MKSIPVIIFSLSFSLIVQGQTSISDTIFILRDTTRGTGHIIYIENNKTSKYYERISTFEFGRFDTISFNSSLDYLKEKNKLPFTKHNLKTLTKQWCSLYYYKDKFYLYSPSDYMFNFRLSISDTTYTEYLGEGPEASRINSFTKLDDKTYKLDLTTHNQPHRIVIIHIIDKENGIALFEEPGEAKSQSLYLMVMAEKIRNFPIIVNYCKDQKTVEFNDFDQNLSNLLLEN